MSNPLFNQLNNQSNLPFGFGSPIEMAQSFSQFKQTVQGDPKQMVQNLLNSGQMSQEQFNQLSSMANSLKNILH